MDSLRQQMNLARQALGLTAPPYTDPYLEDMLIRAVHVTEMQERTQ